MTDGARDPAETGRTPDLFSVQAVPGVDLVWMEFRLPGMAPLAAAVSSDEALKVKTIFDHIAEHGRRGESVRIDLRAAFVDLIGRDPFVEQ